MNVFCKLNRITFHFFNFTLSLSSRQLAILLLRCSPYIPFVNSITFSPSNSTSAPPCRLFLAMPTPLFTPRLPCATTNPRYLNTQLPRFPHKSIPYITRAYARERKGCNVSTPRPASHESHHPTPFTHSHQHHKSKIWPSAPLSKRNKFEKISGANSHAPNQPHHRTILPQLPQLPLKKQ